MTPVLTVHQRGKQNNVHHRGTETRRNTKLIKAGPDGLALRAKSIHLWDTDTPGKQKQGQNPSAQRWRRSQSGKVGGCQRRSGYGSGDSEAYTRDLAPPCPPVLALILFFSVSLCLCGENLFESLEGPK
jgi:hypothetical protein